MENENQPNTEALDIDALNSQYFTLRVGETIPRLKVARLKKVSNTSKPDNLSGVDYKYVLESVDGRALFINTWTLWRKVSAVLKEAGTTQVTLELSHPAVEDYRVRVVD